MLLMQKNTEWLFWNHANKQMQSPWPGSDMVRTLQNDHVSSRSALLPVKEVLKRGSTITQVRTFQPFIILNQNLFHAGHRKNSGEGASQSTIFLTSF